MLEIRNAVKSYRLGNETVQVLKDINLSLVPGEVACLIGSSSSGKSTLLNILAGMEALDAGEVWVGGRPIAGVAWGGELEELRHDSALRSAPETQLAFVSLPRMLSFGTTVEEDVGNVPELMFLEREEKEAAVWKALMLTGLTHRVGVRGEGIGEADSIRLAVARVLPRNPKLLILDEALGLSDKTAPDIIKMLKNIAAESGISILMVTEGGEWVAGCPRRISLKFGTVAEDSQDL